MARSQSSIGGRVSRPSAARRLGGALGAGNGTLIVLFVLAALAPQWVSEFRVQELTTICLVSLVAAGLNLSLGYGGQLALSHVFFYGAAAYLAGLLAIHVTTDLIPLLIAGGVLAALGGLLIGLPGLRLSHWTLGLVSFFLIALIPDLLRLKPDFTGGSEGLLGIPPLTLGGATLDTNGIYLASLIALFVWLVFQRNLVRSRFGRAFAVLKGNEIELASLGVSVRRLKLLTYVIGSVPAGVAGVIFASTRGVVTPDDFSIDTAILVLAAVVIGGQRTLWGPVLGVAIIEYVSIEFVGFGRATTLVYGAFLVLVSVLVPGGLLGTLADVLPERVRRLWRPRPPSPGSRGVALEAADSRHVAEPATIRVSGVSKSFGGVQALRDVELVARPGRVSALIGPNGSGKTTLLNTVSGFVRADSGTMHLGDELITGRPVHAVADRGVARTFQTPSAVSGLSVHEAVAVAAYRQSRVGILRTVLRTPAWHREEAGLAQRVRAVLEEVGLGSQAETAASSLSLGQKRLLEIARALVTRPRVLLLDEPASGLDPPAIAEARTLLERIAAQGTSVLLVEHNLDLVLSVSDHVCVLRQGELIAQGPPGEVVRDPAVIAAYLGEDYAQANASEPGADGGVDPETAPVRP